MAMEKKKGKNCGTVDQTLAKTWHALQDPKIRKQVVEALQKDPSFQESCNQIYSGIVQFEAFIENNREVLHKIGVSFTAWVMQNKDWLIRFYKECEVAGEGRGKFNCKEIRGWLLVNIPDKNFADKKQKREFVSVFLEYCSYIPETSLSFQQLLHNVADNPSRFRGFYETAKKADIAEPVIVGRKAGGKARMGKCKYNHKALQENANAVWAKDPAKSKKSVSEIISRKYRGEPSPNTIRQVIKKPDE